MADCSVSCAHNALNEPYFVAVYSSRVILACAWAGSSAAEVSTEITCHVNYYNNYINLSFTKLTTSTHVQHIQQEINSFNLSALILNVYW
jgi:transcription elongation factor Elf1